MGVTIARVEKRYKEKLKVSFKDCENIIKFLEQLNSDEYQLGFREFGDYFFEFVSYEFNRYCEETGLDNIPIEIKWFYETITKPANLEEDEFMEIEWWG